MSTSCFITADLSLVRMVGGPTASWTPTVAVTDPSAAAMALRARAGESARWAVSQTRRLSLVCVDTAEAQCAFIKTPNANPMVLSAAIRAAGQDWGDRFTIGSVQPLTDPAPAAAEPAAPARKGLIPSSWTRPIGKSAAELAPVRGPALAAPLGLARLWLDELDARGVRPDRVTSLWHAMGLAWTSPGSEELSAVIAIEPEHRAVWAWSRGGRLLAGGQQSLEHRVAAGAATAASDDPVAPPDPVAAAERFTARLALDWLAWAAPLGELPARVVLVGPETRALALALRSRWPQVRVEEQGVPDAIEATLPRAAAPLAELKNAAPDPRRELTVLTSRPTRAVRTQYRWAAASLVLLAAGIGVLGWRFRESAKDLASTAAQVQSQQGTLVESLKEPSLAESRNLLMALSSMLSELRKKEPPRLPPAHRPVFEEVRRIAGVLSKYEGTKLLTLSIDARGTSVTTITVPDRRTGEEIRVALQQEPGAIEWTQSVGGVGSDQQVRLSGAWTR